MCVRALQSLRLRDWCCLFNSEITKCTHQNNDDLAVTWHSIYMYVRDWGESWKFGGLYGVTLIALVTYSKAGNDNYMYAKARHACMHTRDGEHTAQTGGMGDTLIERYVSVCVQLRTSPPGPPQPIVLHLAVVGVGPRLHQVLPDLIQLFLLLLTLPGDGLELVLAVGHFLLESVSLLLNTM